jgi:UDPglucose 6-dehydrogenase
MASDAHEVARDADAVVLVTEWPQYLELDWESLASVMRTPILLDTRHALDRGRITRAGFRYLTLAG